MEMKRRWSDMPRKSRRNLPNLPQEIINLPKIIKYATWGYARISGNSSERTEDSIENQLAIIQEYATNRTDLNLQDMITDLGFSGANFDRPGYAKLMDGVMSGSVQCIIVKDVSRLGRSYLEVGELLFNILPTHNVRFISITDQYDSFSDDATRKKLFMIIKNLMNHMYSRDISAKIRASKALKQKNGELLGTLPSYGYIFTTEGGKKRLKIEPKSAEVVKLIFDMRMQGNSMVKIASYLNQEGIYNPRHHYYNLGILSNEKDSKNTLWLNNVIGNILRNEVYIGNQVQGKYEQQGMKSIAKPKEEWIVHQNTHPAIIDKEQFDSVQKLLNEAGIKFKKHGNKMDKNIFVGKVFCSRCGKALKRQYYHIKNGTIYFYKCRNCDYELRRSKGFEKPPKFTLEQLEEIVTVILQRQIDVCVNMTELITDASNASAIVHKRNSLTAKLNQLQRDSKKADDMLATAYTHHLAGILDSKEFELAREKFERDKKYAEANAKQISDELAGYEIEKTQQNAFLTNFQRFKGFTKLDRCIIEALIQRIDISLLSNEISVTLNFTDELEKLNRIVEESGVLTDVR